jgi:hypothetical protein
MKNIKFILILILLISCEAKNTENCHKIITVVNKTNKTIYIDQSGNYPDVEAYKNLGSPLLTGFTKVDANVSTNAVLPSFGSCYENIYKNSVPSGIMMVYVFDGPTLETQGWDYIKANNLVLKRYDLTLKDLEDANWTITYDGN